MKPITIACCSLAVFMGLAPAATQATNDSRDTASPFGVLEFLPWDSHSVYNHYDDDKVKQAAALMKEAGIGIVRMDILWQDVEPQPRQFDFSKYDRLLDLLDEQGLKVLAILEYNPAWRKNAWNAAPITSDYVDFARATVHHFKSRIKYWEIWNEPDSKTYWLPQDGMVAYTELLKAVYPAIKQEDPTAQVVLGGLTENGPFALRRIYVLGGKNDFDIVNIHPFVNPLRPKAIQTLKGIYYSLTRMMAEFNDSAKPIWFTELGCPGVTEPKRENGWWHGTSPTEAQQAEWITTLYADALKWPGVQKVFWAFFRETGHFFHCGVDNFGLVREDFSKKPAYEAYKKAAHAN